MRQEVFSRRVGKLTKLFSGIRARTIRVDLPARMLVVYNHRFRVAPDSPL
jgi:hypothetical protein